MTPGLKEDYAVGKTSMKNCCAIRGTTRIQDLDFNNSINENKHG